MLTYVFVSAPFSHAKIKNLLPKFQDGIRRRLLPDLDKAVDGEQGLIEGTLL